MLFSFLIIMMSVSLPESSGLGVALNFSHTLLYTGVSSPVPEFLFPAQQSVVYKFQATFLVSEDTFQIIHMFTSLPSRFCLSFPIFFLSKQRAKQSRLRHPF